MIDAQRRGRKTFAAMMLALVAFSSGCRAVQPLEGPAVIPRASAAPVLDGKLTDPCWQTAATLRSFSVAGSMRGPAKDLDARVTFDDVALYVGVRCAEPDPKRLRARILAENDSVWEDDSMQVFVRASDDYLDYDQFIANPLGTRGWHRPRGPRDEPADPPAFRVKTSVDDASWTAEFAIPLSDLGIDSPAPGRAVGLKIGRGDQVSRPAQLVVWPPGAEFAGPENFATVLLGREGDAPPAGRAAVGQAIAVAAGAEQPTVVKKLLVADCRAVRGFIGTPVDGSVESFGWDGRFWEYNKRGAGAGVGYHYHNNDGLHIRLADDGGFDAVQVRGGVKASFYRDVPSWSGPEGGMLLANLPGGTRGTTCAWFEPRVKTTSVSFFGATDGYVSDVAFFRVSHDAAGFRPPERLVVSGAVKHDPERLPSRFGKDDRARFGLRRTSAASSLRADAVDLPADRWVHLVGEPMAIRTALAALGLSGRVEAIDEPIPLTVRIQDAVDTRRELFVADLAVDKAGDVHVICDFPDEVLPPGSQVWVSLKSAKPARLRRGAVDLYVVDRKTAAPEALAYRKLILHSMYSALSEPRPWNVWYFRDKVAEFLKSSSPYAPGAQNIVDALDHCRFLDPEGKDEEVRQYHEWIWRGVLRKEGKTPPFEAKFDLVEGAPEWACLARQAWLQARAVPAWWMEHRLVPTGEFGGVVGDDTDMYQNYSDFVMFETDDVAVKLKDAAARLAELASETTMTEGVNTRTMDPLHAYEEGLNQYALMAFWNYGDPVYLERCMDSARSMEWLTWVTPKGHRHFRSQRIGAAMRNDPKTDVDGHAHPLMWHPTFELVRYNLHPLALKWLREWGDGWLEHMKPGDYAKSVNVAAETVTESDKTPFPGGYGGQGSAFESLYWITGETKYIEPFLDAFRTGSVRTSPGNILSELYQRGALDGLTFSTPLPSEREGKGEGDAASSAVPEAPGPKPEAAVLDLLKNDPLAFAQATGDKGPLCEALKHDITELQRYPMFYTTVEPFTDRVFLYAISNAARAYTGGYATRNKYCRTHAVSYEGLGTDFAALVMAARPDHFKVLLYNFADGDLKGRIRLWTLRHGTYALTAGIDANRDDEADAIGRREVVEIMRATSVEVTLAPKKVTVLELRMLERLDDERLRADLALSPLDTKRADRSVESVAHNIGTKDVPQVTVALVDATGKVIQKQDLGPLEAPLDLVPRRIPFKFDGLPADASAWSIVIDPDGKLAEIYEGNNVVRLEK